MCMLQVAVSAVLNNHQSATQKSSDDYIQSINHSFIPPSHNPQNN